MLAQSEAEATALPDEDPDRRKASQRYILTVQHLIERCLILHLDQDQCVQALSRHARVLPQVTATVWQQLEQENQEFFASYGQQRREGRKRRAYEQMMRYARARLSGQRGTGEADSAWSSAEPPDALRRQEQEEEEEEEQEQQQQQQQQAQEQGHGAQGALGFPVWQGSAGGHATPNESPFPIGLGAPDCHMGYPVRPWLPMLGFFGGTLPSHDQPLPVAPALFIPAHHQPMFMVDPRCQPRAVPTQSLESVGEPREQEHLLLAQQQQQQECEQRTPRRQQQDWGLQKDQQQQEQEEKPLAADSHAGAVIGACEAQTVLPT